MTPFITVSRQDAQFWPLLTGQFSKTHFARPVSSLHVNSHQETITFKIIEMRSPSLIRALAHWYSVARNIYLIFPILAGLTYLTVNFGWPQVDLVITSFLSLQFFLMSMTLYNDYRDYLMGIDRVNEYNTKKPLVQGLMRPYQARQLAVLFFFLSALLASYCFIQRPESLIFGVIAILVAVALVSQRVRESLKGFSVLTNFMLAGPLLIVGYEFLLYETMSVASVLLGALFGMHALKYDFLKQMREIFYSSKAQVTTLSTWAGFERSKYVFSLLSLLHLTVLALLAWHLGFREWILLVVVCLYFETYINRLVHGAASFLSSQIGQSLSLQKLHFVMETSLIILIFLSSKWLS